MAETTAVSSKSNRRRWPRILAWLVAVLVVLSVAAYFVVTNPGFIRSVILPRVSEALGTEITVSRLSLHPFSSLTLSGLKIQTKGQEPILTAPEIRLRYHLWSILAGNLRVDEITLVSPTLMVVQNPDGTGNLDALLKSTAGKPPSAPRPPAAKSAKPLRIDVQKVTVSNAAFWQVKNYAGGRRDCLGVTNVSLSLTGLKNGQSGKLQLGAGMVVELNPPTGPEGHLEAALKGDFDFTLSADAKPAPVAGRAVLEVSRASGAFNNFSGFSAALDCNVTPSEIKQASLHFQRDGVPLGELAVSGPLDMEKMEGHLRVELRGIDRRLLNLAGDASGIDFGPTTVSSTNDLELTQGGSVIGATGSFDAVNVQLTRAGQTTPVLNFNAGYNIVVNSAAQTAQVRALNLTGTQNGGPLLAAQLSQPMNLAWGRNAAATGDSALNLNVTGLNLAEWQPFLGRTPIAGDVSAALRLSSQSGGRKLVLGLNSRIQDFSTAVGGHSMAPMTVTLQARGQVADLKQFNLSDCRLQVAQQDRPLATVTVSGTGDNVEATADLQLALQASLPALSQVISQPGTSFASGTVDLQAHVVQKRGMQTVTGKLTLARLAGQAGSSRFCNFSSTVDLDVARTPERIRINKIAGSVAESGKAGGAFDLAGTGDPVRQSVQLTAKLTDFNQDGLRPFLEPLLAGKQLVSVAVNGNASVAYDPQASSSIQAGIKVANLVVSDPQQHFPASPLEASWQLDAAVNKSSANLRRFQLTLTPTRRAANQVQLQGRVDFSQPKAIRGNLKLAAQALDLTRYYDLFAGNTASAGAPPVASPAAAPAPVAANPEQEPPAKILPFKNFTVVADIGRLYLREVDIARLQATANLDGGQVRVQPLQLTLNGAPVNAALDLNLGVPGYRYDVTFGADQVPVAPLVDTFAPARAGQMGGTATAHAQISGAGVTGAGLQRNLAGLVTVGVTNLNLSVVNVHSSLLKSVINVVAIIPDLLINPENALASLVGQVTGRGGGLMGALEQSPIQVINARVNAGNGRIEVQQAAVQSAVFHTDATGDVALARVLTNSTINIPVIVSLARPTAVQLNLADRNAPAGGAYVPLPQFLTLRGTLGAPKPDVNKLALGRVAGRSIGAGLMNTATNTASVVGGFLHSLLNKVNH